ncbi:MAG: carboxymethylenebutenolidase [Paraglaciecola sp.]|jgi:carboxymethylenebutenolidase
MAAVSYLKKYEPSTRKLGIVGSCFGGYLSNILAATASELINAAVPF